MEPAASSGGATPITAYTFDLLGRLKTVTDPLSNVTTYVFFDTDWLKSETVDGYSRTLEYDAAGNVRHRTDRLGREISYEYDALNRRIEEEWSGTGANSYVATFDYNLAGEMIAASDENVAGANSALDFVYDELGQLEESEAKIGALPEVTLNYAYDLIGTRNQLTAQVGGAQDLVQTYAYNKHGSLIGTTQQGSLSGFTANNQQKQVGLEYLSNGLLQRVKREEVGQPTAGVYWKETDDNNSDSGRFVTNLPAATSATGALNDEQRVAPSAGTGTLGATWKFRDLGNLRRFDVYVTWKGSASLASDAKYRVYLDERDEDPVYLDETVEYVAHQVNQKNDPEGITINGQVWQLLGVYTTNSYGRIDVVITDGADGPVAADGVLIVEHLEVNTDFTYTSSGQLDRLRHFQNTNPADGPNAIRSQTLQYAAGNGRLNQVTTSIDGGSGQVQDFSHDDQNQLTGQTGAATNNYAYDVHGNPLGTLYTNKRLYQDANHRYVYDDEGNVIEQWWYKTMAVVGGSSLTTSTDPLIDDAYRLMVEPFTVTATTATIKIRLKFGTTEIDTFEVETVAGASGTRVNPNGVFFDFTTTSLGSPTTVTVELLDDNDAAITLVSGTFRVTQFDSRQEYQWNHRNQLIEAKVSTSILLKHVKYGYDALGRRISKTYAEANGTTPPSEYYVHDAGGVLLQLEKHNTGSADILRVTRRFFAGPTGELFAVEEVHYPSGVATSKEVVWALSDYQNTVRDLYWRDATGEKLVEHRLFDPFGAPLQPEASSSGRIVEAMTAGVMRDWETGLHFDGQRYLTPASGRYISEAYGSVGLGETNLYLFAGNNPVQERVGPAPATWAPQDLGMFHGYGSYYLNPVNDFRDGNYGWGIGKAIGWTMAAVPAAVAAKVVGVGAAATFVVKASITGYLGKMTATGALIGLNYHVWRNNAAMADAMSHGRAINPQNTPWNPAYLKGAAASTAIGAALGFGIGAAAPVMPWWAGAGLSVGLGGYGVYADGSEAWRQFRSGNYFQAGFHAAASVTWGALGAYGAYSSYGARPVGPSNPRSITPYRDPARPGYNNGATHMDHAQARSLGGTNDPVNLRPLPAETNLRKGGYEGELKSYEGYLIRNGMSPKDARSVIQSEIDSMRISPPPRPMDPNVLDRLPANPMDQGHPH